METLPAVEPCSTDYCFMSRDGVLGVPGNVFSTANYMMGLVVQQGYISCPLMRALATGINTIDCANNVGPCPRFEAQKESLKALGGYQLLDQVLAAEQQQQPLPPVYVEAGEVYIIPLPNGETGPR